MLCHLGMGFATNLIRISDSNTFCFRSLLRQCTKQNRLAVFPSSDPDSVCCDPNDGWDRSSFPWRDVEKTLSVTHHSPPSYLTMVQAIYCFDDVQLALSQHEGSWHTHGSEVRVPLMYPNVQQNEVWFKCYWDQKWHNRRETCAKRLAMPWAHQMYMCTAYWERYRKID